MICLQTLATEALAVAPRIFAIDFTRYAFGAGGVFLLVNGLFSDALKGRRIRDRTLREGQIKRELLTSLRTILIFTGVGAMIWVGKQFGVLRIYHDPAALGWVWFAASVVIAIVAHDAWFYWTHRLLHLPRVFRRTHKTHHKSKNPTPFTAYAFDWPEALINAVFLLIIAVILPLSSLAIFIFLAHMMVRNAIGHCGYELFPRRADGRPMFDWMTTVTHHDIHHAEGGWNFGLYFTFWDRVMGTEHPNYYERFAASVRRSLIEQPRPHNADAIVIAIAALFAGLWASGFFAGAPLSDVRPNGVLIVDAARYNTMAISTQHMLPS